MDQIFGWQIVNQFKKSILHHLIIDCWEFLEGSLWILIEGSLWMIHFMDASRPPLMSVPETRHLPLQWKSVVINGQWCFTVFKSQRYFLWLLQADVWDTKSPGPAPPSWSNWWAMYGNEPFNWQSESVFKENIFWTFHDNSKLKKGRQSIQNRLL